MAIPGYRWVLGLVREHRYEQALKEKGVKTWDEWLDERIVPPKPLQTTAASLVTPAERAEAPPGYIAPTPGQRTADEILLEAAESARKP